jgi:adenylate cyclase
VSVKSLSSLLSLYTLYSWLFSGLGLFLIAFGIILSTILIFRLNAPLKRLTAAINDLHELKFQETEYPVTNIKEINMLYDTFDFMEKGFKSFARYVPIGLIQKIMNSGVVAEVYGESREITLLFTDIRGFTTIAENMQARELMFYLSEYFEAMTNTIMSKGGTLDKYIGDAIVAFWGAPFDDKNHVLHACQCALMIEEALDRLNKVWKQRGMPELSLRIGINSGYSVVGNVGSRYRLSYTAMGDTVNLASRLEELNKEYGTDILVGEDTYRAVRDQFSFRMVDLVETRGKKESTMIYELLQRSKLKLTPPELKDYNLKIRDAFNVYRAAEWDKALNIFTELLKEYPDDKIILMFISRCKQFKESPPKKWNGSWAFKI